MSEKIGQSPYRRSSLTPRTHLQILFKNLRGREQETKLRRIIDQSIQNMIDSIETVLEVVNTINISSYSKNNLVIQKMNDWLESWTEFNLKSKRESSKFIQNLGVDMFCLTKSNFLLKEMEMSASRLASNYSLHIGESTCYWDKKIKDILGFLSNTYVKSGFEHLGQNWISQSIHIPQRSKTLHPSSFIRRSIVLNREPQESPIKKIKMHSRSVSYDSSSNMQKIPRIVSDSSLRRSIETPSKIVSTSTKYFRIQNGKKIQMKHQRGTLRSSLTMSQNHFSIPPRSPISSIRKIQRRIKDQNGRNSINKENSDIKEPLTDILANDVKTEVLLGSKRDKLQISKQGPLTPFNQLRYPSKDHNLNLFKNVKKTSILLNKKKTKIEVKGLKSKRMITRKSLVNTYQEVKLSPLGRKMLQDAKDDFNDVQKEYFNVLNSKVKVNYLDTFKVDSFPNCQRLIYAGDTIASVHRVNGWLTNKGRVIDCSKSIFIDISRNFHSKGFAQWRYCLFRFKNLGFSSPY